MTTWSVTRPLAGLSITELINRLDPVDSIDGPPLYSLDNWLNQSLDGHSIGAPMVAATLALMEEKNQRLGRGYSMRELVRILKQSASRDFPGYDRNRHGVGILNVSAAIDAL